TIDASTRRESVVVEDFPTTTDAFTDLIAFCRDEQWTITPTLDDDGVIVYLLAGDDISEGLATIS
ncbi:hypothetical protein CH256_26250, partial [Rhodococcus sp. 05-2254-6]|uniref:hypothetical protein n=1 Tax=Rhodococcus sp. 05-2254-6 TaxID=2022489 RepID=UPI000BD422F3